MFDTKPVEFQSARLKKSEVYAIKNLYDGKASEYEQRLALTVIVNKLSRTHDVLYIPDRPEASAFLNGRAFVGMEILKLLKQPIGKLKDYYDED